MDKLINSGPWLLYGSIIAGLIHPVLFLTLIALYGILALGLSLSMFNNLRGWTK